MRVFQPQYKTGDGQKRLTTHWYVEFADHKGAQHRVRGFTNKRETDKMALRILDLVAVRASSGTLPADLNGWVEGLSPKLRDDLAGVGLLDAGKVAAVRPLVEHLDGAPEAPGWRQFLSAKGNTQKHVDLFCGRVRRIFTDCGMAFWGDLSATRIMDYLSDLRSDKVNEDGKVIRRGISAAGFNGYVTAAMGFSRWMVREGRTTSNALAGLRKVNERTDRRHERRAVG